MKRIAASLTLILGMLAFAFEPSPVAKADSSSLNDDKTEPVSEDRTAAEVKAPNVVTVSAKPVLVPRAMPVSQIPDAEHDYLYNYENNLGSPKGQVEMDSTNEAAAVRIRHRAGIRNFSFGVPLASLPGRGIDAGIGMTYNSRTWTKSVNAGGQPHYTYDVEESWIAPGFSTGFGYLDTMAVASGSLYTIVPQGIVESDGTRRQFTCTPPTSPCSEYRTTDGSFIRVGGPTVIFGLNQYANATFILTYPNGSRVYYAGAFGTGTSRRHHPVIIQDSNGNRIKIAYKNMQSGRIDYIHDTLNRRIKFYYENVGGIPDKLVAVTIPAMSAGSSAHRTRRKIMKSLIVLFLVGLNFPTCDLRSLNHKQQSENEMVVMSLPPKTEDCGKDNYKHKSEAEIAQLTPAQRVDEYAEEQAHHKYDVLDEHSELIAKYILRDGLKILPRTIEIMNEYDPTHASGKSGNKGERFDAMWMLLGNLDENIIRLRGKEDGKRALEALERAIVRMKAADYGQPDQHDWERHGRFELAVSTLEETKGINETDEAIKDTFRLEYKILLSNLELLAFSNFLTAQYPEYPSSSETNYFRDYTQINEAGNPLWVRTLKKPKCYYEAYLEFKKTKRGRKPDDPNRQGAGVYGHILMQAGAHLAGRPVMAITGYLVDGLQLAFSRPQSSEEMAGNYAGPPVGRQMWNYLTGGRDKDELRKSLTNELCE